ncbi:MAG TPA: 4'-phosphopantetheinyl transferase superfamily protein [Steroidobacteraceae bacterium]|nr:4'-phosphopantetheinyl transferase superfamily protein [Steroidobacteraceae bacterium]
MSRALADNGVHVWLGFENLLDDPANAARFTSLMSQDELVRDRRFLVEPARRLHRLARGMQREVLASYLPGTSPRELEFVNGPAGRPALAAPHDASGLDFNLAHTRGLVVLAVARGATVGIDVEIYEKNVPLEVARRFFSGVEADTLQALPGDAQPRRFLRLWTLKEAYLKAVGTGIAGGLEGMTFRIDEQGGCNFERATDPLAARWSFSQFDVGARHVVALALLPARESAMGAAIEWHEFGGAAPPAAVGIHSLIARQGGLRQEQRAEP